MLVITTLLQVILIAIFLLSGVGKIYGLPMHIDNFNRLRLPQWFRVVTGIVQLIGAAMFIIGFWKSDWAEIASLWLGITMIGAILAHVRVKDNLKQAAAAIIILCLLFVLIAKMLL
ncbi:hypothetical protein BK133_28930 [Paenibacillus sp. FSL H8-0548]|uniref:DoxX family protein n=1 Tax=Paenibacillus sp. FSL H8-0548 TaxID=1920422 RepID=UPI00096E943D|nr:DoxX family protein [Paenibacillus sp. FSL H8-0548]OMF21106.1 hypothetical protein BK133_28930 [Paenibacillus sp. FSL H8-0548]